MEDPGGPPQKVCRAYADKFLHGGRVLQKMGGGGGGLDVLRVLRIGHLDLEKSGPRLPFRGFQGLVKVRVPNPNSP